MFSPKLSLSLLVGLSTLGANAGASGNSFHPMVSADSRKCFLDAISDASKSRYQPALAKLESLLMLQPVSVGIDGTTLPAKLASYQSGVEKGIGIWRDALADSPFARSKDAKHRPMVLIKFVRQLPAQGGDLQGMIEAEHEFKWNAKEHLSKLTSTMYVVYRTEGRNLTVPEISEVVAHELGHLLGLNDASGPSGLMGPFVAGEPRLAPSATELDAVHEFRQMVKDQIGRIQESL